MYTYPKFDINISLFFLNTKKHKQTLPSLFPIPIEILTLFVFKTWAIDPDANFVTVLDFEFSLRHFLTPI